MIEVLSTGRLWAMKLSLKISETLKRISASHSKTLSQCRGRRSRVQLAAQALESRTLLTTIDLAALISGQGTTIFGADAGDNSGHSISSAGDVNGDGFEDLLIGASGADAAGNAKSKAGDSYLIFGKPGWSTTPTINLGNLGAAGITFFGAEANDYSGRSVSSAGDVNGDGFADLLIGADRGDSSGNARADAGDSYLIFGKANWIGMQTIDLNNLGTSGITILGAEELDRSGLSVSNAGDVNGDGFDDMLIGAYRADAASNARSRAGDSYIIFGKADWSGTSTIDLSNLGTAGVTIFGVDASDESGRSLSSAGDVNGDGFDDLLVGATGGDASGNAKSYAGDSYLIFGKASMPTTIDLASLGTAGITIFGAGSYDFSGRAVSSAGDVNGDGFDDLLIGAYNADASDDMKSDAGDTYMIFGKANWSATPTIDLSNPGSGVITIFGADRLDQSGRSVSSAGDVNGDGFGDLLIGANLADSSGNARADSGDSYVIFGKADWSATPSIDLAKLGQSGQAAGITIFGADADDNSGRSVSGAGDVNGDGFDDLLIGAHYANASGNAKDDAGEGYIIFGGNNFTGSILAANLGSSAANTITGTTAGDLLNGAGGNDTLVGAGGADVLIGGQGNDTLAVSDATFRRIHGGTGTDTVRLDGSGLHLNLTSIADNRLVNIEQIDITGSGNNTLTLNQREVLNISNTSNTLTVVGNVGDSVQFGPGWTLVAQELGFMIFTQGAATLEVSESITVPAHAKPLLDLATLGIGGVTIFGADTGDSSGISVSNAGDVNGDGFDDVLIGASAADATGNAKSLAGDSYVIFGGPSLPTTIDLGNLGVAGVTIFGPDAGDRSGISVSSAGDVNGDGFDDLLIGAYTADASGNGKSYAGDSYLIFGQASLPATIDLASLGSAGVTFYGAEVQDRSGRSVSSAGDVNGDGFDDVLIGAYAADAAGNSKSLAGDCYVIFGGLSMPPTLDLGNLGEAGINILGAEAGDRSGDSVSSAGDVNGDGFDDLLIGASSADASNNSKSAAGDSYVIFGGASLPTTIDLATLATVANAGITIFGADVNDGSGGSLSSAGDVNGDGFDDLLIGASSADASNNSKSAAGDSYVIFGGASLPTTIDLATLATVANAGITIFGADVNDGSGGSLSSAGDVNGDGFDDLLIGALGGDGDASGNAKSSAGDSYVVFGGDFTASVTHLGTSAGEKLTGSAVANVMTGGRGNDILIGNGGADVLSGGQGNDLLAVSSTTFRRIVGGTGSDTLRLDGTGLSLNLTTLRDNRIVDVEMIDITGSGNNTLTLNHREVVNISGESNRLLVRRNVGDVVNIGLGWAQGADQILGGIAYHILTQGAATLGIEVTRTGGLVQLLGSTLTVTGSALADTVSVSAATNVTVTLNGVGMDFAPASVTAIVVNGYNGDDTITAISLKIGHAFTANGGNGNDILTVLPAVLNGVTLNGDADNDTLTGGGGNDRLTGSSGNDLLIGGFGNDSYDFGPATGSLEADSVTESSNSGIDTLNFSSITTNVIVNLTLPTIQAVHTNRTLKLNLGTTLENANGGSGNDALGGNTLANTLIGNGGNDAFYGGLGSDVLLGGPGNDTYHFSPATGTPEADSVTESTNAGTDTLSFAGITTNVVVNLTLATTQAVHTNRTLKLNSGSTLENANGGSGNDAMGGNSLGNVLSGNGGNDALYPGLGNDYLIGGPGDDTYHFSTATAGLEADTVTELAGSGTDTLNFAGIQTNVIANLALTTVQNVHANRTLKLNLNNSFESVLGGSANDTLTGNALDNILVGNAGVDTLVGGDGRDMLIGGLGLDTLNGGTGDDIFIAGRTTSDTSLINLNILRTQWISSNTYAVRIANLRAGVGNPVVSLKARINVLNDAGEDDSLTGGGNSDWFFRAVDDVITDLLTGESLDLL